MIHILRFAFLSWIVPMFLLTVFPVSLRAEGGSGSVSSGKTAELPPAQIPAHRLGIAWWKARFGAKAAEQERLRASGGKIGLVLLGDSITQGWETAGRKQAALLAGHVGGVLNLGYSGDRTEHLLWRLEHGELDGIRPRAVALLIGTNNTGHCPKRPAAETAAAVGRIVGRLRTKVPDAVIVLHAIFPRGPADGSLRRINEEINTLIRPLADGRTVIWLDLRRDFLDGSGNIPGALMPDGLHPADPGYVLWREALCRTFDRLP